MVDFKVVVNNPKDGKSYQVAVSGQHANVLVRKRIGDEVDGMFVGLPGYRLKITGGSDKDGFPMRPEINAGTRKRLLVAESVGYHPTDYPGKRVKKSLRGNEITPEISQINAKVVTSGPKAIDELLAGREQAAAGAKK